MLLILFIPIDSVMPTICSFGFWVFCRCAKTRISPIATMRGILEAVINPFDIGTLWAVGGHSLQADANANGGAAYRSWVVAGYEGVEDAEEDRARYLT